MILLISSDTASVNIVISWLVKLKAAFIRINPNYDGIILKELSVSMNGNNDFEIFIPNHNLTIKTCDITSVWIWHGMLSFANTNLEFLSEQVLNLELKNQLKSITKTQDSILVDLFVSQLMRKSKVIGNYHKQGLNKIKVLYTASKVGLLIPSTHIISSKDQLLELSKQYNLITKSISEISYLNYNDEIWVDMTTDLSHHNYTIPEFSYPSLVQEKIEKKFEIRSFFLTGQIYSMAIFSQASPATQVDFRFDSEMRTRSVCYSLPEDISGRINTLMNELELNCGSLDLIYSIDNKYYFLEVNPVGQFGMTSMPCNYYLEKLIAETLTSK